MEVHYKRHSLKQQDDYLLPHIEDLFSWKLWLCFLSNSEVVNCVVVKCVLIEPAGHSYHCYWNIGPQFSTEPPPTLFVLWIILHCCVRGKGRGH